MKRSSYSERDYTFGQALLRLRSSIGLSQASMAELLGITRKAVSHWEVGDSYPKAARRQTLLAFAVGQQAFAPGHEEEEIRAFWRVAHQKVPLDERWLQEVLSRPSPSPASLTGEQTPGDGQDSAASSAEQVLWTIPYARNPHFTGRDDLLEQLMQQLAPSKADQPTTLRRAALTQAQVIKGLGGIGKTQTAIEYAYRARAGPLQAYPLDRRGKPRSHPGELCRLGRAAAGRRSKLGERSAQTCGSRHPLAGAVP